MKLLPSLAFFGMYASILLLHLLFFMTSACLYVSSVALAIVYVATLLILSPLSLHSPTDGWTPIHRECLCGIPKAIWLGATVLLWGILFLINVALLSFIPGVSLWFMLAYGASALLLLGMMAMYAVLFICFCAW